MSSQQQPGGGGGTTPSASDQQQERLAFLVEATDGRRFKMVIKGDLHKLQVEKIRRYLKGNGVPDGLDLVYNGMVLADDMVGEDFGLIPNAVLKLVARGGGGGGGGAAAASSSSMMRSGGGGEAAASNTPSGSSRYRSGSQQQQQQQQQRTLSAARGELGSPSSHNNTTTSSDVESRLRQLQEQYSGFAHSSHHQHSNNNTQTAQHQPQPQQQQQSPSTANAASFYDPVQQERQLRMQRMTGSAFLPSGGGAAPSEAPSGIQYSSANVSLTSHQPFPSSLGGSPAKALPSSSLSTNANMTGRIASTVGGGGGGGGMSASALEIENDRLKREIESLKIDLQRKRQEHPPSDDMLFNAKANLLELSKDLGVHLAFDTNLTCVIGNDEKNTILITFDAATERLYLYSTVLTQLPLNETLRLKLFEALLDGAMLGRDMAGGGIGISAQNNIAMLCTSFSLRNASQYALRDITPAFLEALQRWRAVAADIVSSAPTRY